MFAYVGNAAAVKELVRDRGGNYGKNLLRKVWGIRKNGGTLELPEQAALDNPLLAVMWARFQESCRLFYASGTFPNTKAVIRDRYVKV